jgi:catechol 2,3-dioxygenase-like lactoylglutathione lyase family enzyme
MERAIPIIPAEDLATAKTFYFERLGFRVKFEASKDGHSGLLGIQRGTITLDSPMNGHGRNACVDPGRRR